MVSLKNLAKVAVVGLMSVTSFGNFAAAHEEGKGPHGGVVKEFGGKFHMEGVLEGDSAKFYLLDGDGKKGTSTNFDGGTITIVAGDKSPATTKLDKGSFSEASAPVGGSGKISAAITLKIDGKAASSKFSFKK